MHRATVLPLIVLAAVVVGGLLYLYGGPSFHRSYLGTSPGDASQTSSPGGGSQVTVLAQGANAPGMDERVNYRILNVDQLTALWQMLYPNSGQPVPRVDFEKYEVLALFDGSHTTGGYGVELSSIKDAGGQRVITITHSEPGDNCVTASGIMSPFVILQVTKSPLPIKRVEQTVSKPCN